MSKNQNKPPNNQFDLLRTKITPPHSGASLVLRPELLERLDQALSCKLTLISAPAGFGKTTLVTEWLYRKDEGGRMKDEREQVFSGSSSPAEDAHPGFIHPSSLIPHPSKVAWLALDGGDNDPARFWRYFIAAFQLVAPERGETTLALLNSGQQVPVEVILTRFINELTHLERRCLLVLEDYHVITSPQIQAGMAFLLEHLPATLRLLIITRTNPPLPLARLRACNELREFHAGDLRFSDSYARTFLQQNSPFELNSYLLDRIVARAEGWPAGLRLVALMLQGWQAQSEVEEWLAGFSGGNHQILEYLVSEVFYAQTFPIREFLLKTSFLGRLNASLCEAVTGRDDSALRLDEVEQANLFLLPLDGTGQWYRYHELFAEAMHQFARRHLGETELAALYTKASLWYEQHALLPEAVEYALAARDYPRVIELIEANLGPAGFTTEIFTLRRWVEQLPEKLLNDHPDLCFNYAIAILYTSDRHLPATRIRVERPLQVAERYWQAQDNLAKLGEVHSFRSSLAWWQEDFELMFASARQALSLLPPAEIYWRSIVVPNLGLEKLFCGQLSEALDFFQEGQRLCTIAENPYGRRACLMMRAEVAVLRKDLRLAVQLYNLVLEEAGEDFSDKSYVLAGLAEIYFEWNKLEEAEQYATEALKLGRECADESLQVSGMLVLARLRHARGETVQARQLLQTLAEQTTNKWSLLYREVRYYEALFTLAAGDLTAVQRWASVISLSGALLPYKLQEREALLVARIQIAQGEIGAALQLLADREAKARALGCESNLQAILLLRALAQFRGGNFSQAVQTACQTLHLACSQGYRRLFIEEGEPVAILLRAALTEINDDYLASYVRGLLLDFSQQSSNTPGKSLPAPVKALPVVEPLSQQEQRVLQLLAVGLSNVEIAREQVVSINTVKTQIKSIYRKLDISRRDQARELARHLV
jgi:LuxR family maltose regulon positive regulatory protein